MSSHLAGSWIRVSAREILSESRITRIGGFHGFFVWRAVLLNCSCRLKCWVIWRDSQFDWGKVDCQLQTANFFLAEMDRLFCAIVYILIICNMMNLVMAVETLPLGPLLGGIFDL